jgi:hypothetical protein
MVPWHCVGQREILTFSLEILLWFLHWTAKPLFESGYQSTRKTSVLRRIWQGNA